MVSDRIRFLRKKNNWSQVELASKLGITRSSVNAWEHGNSIPTTAMLIKLINLFQVSADFLLETNHNADVLSLEQLDEAEKAVICKLADIFLADS